MSLPEIISLSDTGHLGHHENLHRRFNEGWVSVTDHGAVGDGVTDDTAAVQAAITAAQTTGGGGVVFFPEGAYRTTATLVMSSAYMRLVGTSPRRSRIVADDTLNAAILQIQGKVGSTFVGVELLAIEGAGAGGAGQHGIEIVLDHATDILSWSWIKRCWIRNQGGYGIKLTNTKYTPPSTNADGLYDFFIQDNVIENGVDLTYAGDSLFIERNMILGDNVGVYLKCVTGGKQHVIRENVILTAQGAIHVCSAGIVTIEDNHLELKSAQTAGQCGDAVIYIEGGWAHQDTVRSVIIRHNNIDGGLRYTTGIDYNIRVGQTKGCLIEDNTILVAATKGIIIDAASEGTAVGQNSYISDATWLDVAPSITDNGKGTMGVWRALSTVAGGYLNSWVDTAEAVQTGRYMKRVDGWVRLSGIVINGTTASGTDI